MQCKYIIDWKGRCKKEALGGSRFCLEHSSIICSCCGAKATRSCDATFGLVCGVPICDDCTHELNSEGTNVCNTTHVKKSDLNYVDWMKRDVCQEMKCDQLDDHNKCYRAYDCNKILPYLKAKQDSGGN